LPLSSKYLQFISLCVYALERLSSFGHIRGLGFMERDLNSMACAVSAVQKLPDFIRDLSVADLIVESEEI